MQDKLDWRHVYQEQLEKLYGLNGEVLQSAGTNTACTGNSQPGSLLGVQRNRDLQTALDSIDKLEQQHQRQIPVRWTPSSVEYQAAALQRKCFHVHMLQSKIAAELDWLRWAKLAVSRTPRQHRGTSSSILRTMRSVNAKVRTAVHKLQDWNAVSGDIGHVPYAPQSILLDNMQQS